MKMSLQKLCVATIAKSIDRYYNIYSSTNAEDVHQRFYILQNVYSFELISQIAEKRLLNEKHAELVFNKYLKYIDTEWLSTFTWKTVVETFERIGPCLEKIAFNDLHHTEALWKDIICLLPNVKSITYRERCNDDILQCIAANCPKLETLDVTRSRHVTDEGLKFFCYVKRGKKRDEKGECLPQNEKVPCPLLKEIILKCTSVKGEGIEQLLQSLPSLEKIDCLKLPVILYRIQKENIGLLDKIKRLTHLDLSWFESQDSYDDILEFCINACPNLKSFICPIYKSAHLDLCSTLPDVANLDLDIYCREVTSNEISDFLVKEGGKIKSLTLRDCCFSLVALGQCHQLKWLDITAVSIQYDENDTVPIFMNLKVLSIRDVDLSDYRDCKGICLILRSSPFLEKLCFEWCDAFPSEMKAEILQCCEQSALKHVEFSESTVDGDLLKDILLTCPTLETLTLAELDLSPESLKEDLYRIANTLPNKPEIHL